MLQHVSFTEKNSDSGAAHLFGSGSHAQSRSQCVGEPKVKGSKGGWVMRMKKVHELSETSFGDVVCDLWLNDVEVCDVLNWVTLGVWRYPDQAQKIASWCVYDLFAVVPFWRAGIPQIATIPTLSDDGAFRVPFKAISFSNLLISKVYELWLCTSSPLVD